MDPVALPSNEKAPAAPAQDATGGWMVSALPAPRSDLFGHQDRDNRLALVAGAAQRLEAHQGRRPLAVVVADVDAEAHLRPAVAPTDGPADQPKHVPEPARFVLALDAGRNR